MRTIFSTILMAVVAFSAGTAQGQGTQGVAARAGAGSAAQGAAALPQAPLPVSPAGDAIYAPIATGPQTLHERFMSYAVLTAGPRALLAPAIPAAARMAFPPNHYPSEWRQGAEAFGRNYGDALAVNVAQHTGRFAAGALLHEDFRYSPSSRKNLPARAFHALSYTFVDKSDSGHPRPALANLAAAGSGGYVGRLYLPDGYDDVSHANTRMALIMGELALTNVAREFAPDVFRLTSRFHTPFPRIPVPQWWTGNPRKNSP